MRKELKVDVFLGGTCADSKWREELIEMLEEEGITYFNPVVEDWNEEARKRENYMKGTASIDFFCLTPKMKGVFSIAEMVDCSWMRPGHVAFMIKEKDGWEEWTEKQRHSLDAVSDLLISRGAYHVVSYRDLVLLLKGGRLKNNE